MNVNDFVAPPCPPNVDTGIALIFDRQHELLETYKSIEQLPSAPVSIHTANGQRILRDFAWRATEELTESYEALVDKHDEDTSARQEHALEELADATHFLVELLLYAGIGAVELNEKVDAVSMLLDPQFSIQHAYWHATYRLGQAMNFLRNKAWKQSEVPTDEVRFREALVRAWAMHLQCWSALSARDQGYANLYSYYFRKSEVNKFRQRSDY